MKKQNKILVSSDGRFYYLKSFVSKEKAKDSCHGLSLETFNNEKIHLVMEGKELFIEETIIPRVRRSYIEKIVQCSLIEKFHTLEHIAFDYEIVKKYKKEIIVLIYCVNLSRGALLEEEKFHRVYLSSVKVIQQLYAEAFRKHLKKNEFYGLVITGNHIYYFHVKDKVIRSNKVEEIESFKDIENFIKGLCKMKIKTKVIYLFKEFPWMEVERLLLDIKDFYIFEIDLNERRKKSFNYNYNAVDSV